MGDGTIIRVMLTLLVAGMRLTELVPIRSWDILQRKPSPGDSAVRMASEPIYPFMVALHALWLVGCLAEPWFMGRDLSPLLFWPMAVCFLLALVLRFWVLWTMGRRWNVRIVIRPDQAVVTTGPYRFIRHPNYLVVIIELAVLPLMTGAYLTAIIASLANALVLWLRILREEDYLFTFPAYREAFADKKRLIPGLF